MKHNPFLKLAQNKLDSLKISKDYDLIKTYQEIQRQILNERDARRENFVKQKFRFKTNDIVRLKNFKVESKKLFNPYSREKYVIIGMNHGVAKLRQICDIDQHPNIRLSHCRFLKKVHTLPDHVVITDKNDHDLSVDKPLKDTIDQNKNSGRLSQTSETEKPQENNRHNYSLRKRSGKS